MDVIQPNKIVKEIIEVPISGAVSKPDTEISVQLFTDVKTVMFIREMSSETNVELSASQIFNTVDAVKIAENILKEIQSLVSQSSEMKYKKSENEVQAKISREEILNKMNTEIRLTKSESNIRDKMTLYSSENKIASIDKNVDEINWFCNKCQEYFSTEIEFDNHLILHTDKFDFICNICGKCFSQKLLLFEHLCKHNIKLPLSFTRELASLRNNPESKTIDKKFKCNVCSKSFIQKSFLHKHTCLRENQNPFHTCLRENQNPFLCIMCHKSFNTKKNLNEHLILHPECRPFICNFCKHSFTHKVCLYNHVFSHVKSANENQMLSVNGNCSGYHDCEVSDPLCREFNGHKKLLKKDILFSCKICTKSFSLNSRLCKHLTINKNKVVPIKNIALSKDKKNFQQIHSDSTEKNSHNQSRFAKSQEKPRRI